MGPSGTGATSAACLPGTVVPVLQGQDDVVVVLPSPGAGSDDVLALFTLNGVAEVMEFVCTGEAGIFLQDVAELVPKVPPLLLLPIKHGQLHTW